MFSANASFAHWRSLLATLELRLTCCTSQERGTSSFLDLTMFVMY